VAEDDDDEVLPADIAVASNAMTKLITLDKVDFVVRMDYLEFLLLTKKSARSTR